MGVGLSSSGFLRDKQCGAHAACIPSIPFQGVASRLVE